MIRHHAFGRWVTDRLDPMDISMVVDEAHHHFARSSSAWAKYADACEVA
jgi:hypothetical protein